MKTLVASIRQYLPAAKQKHHKRLVVDTPEGEAIVSLDADLSDLVPNYLDNRRNDLTQCQAALTQGDFATIRRLMHGMAGSGGSFGFEKLSEIGQQLDHAAIEYNADVISEGLETLAHYLDRITVVYE